MASLEELTQIVEVLSAQVNLQATHIQELETKLEQQVQPTTTRPTQFNPRHSKLGRRHLLKQLAVGALTTTVAASLAVTTSASQAQARIVGQTNPGAIILGNGSNYSNSAPNNTKYGVVVSTNPNIDLSGLPVSYNPAVVPTRIGVYSNVNDGTGNPYYEIGVMAVTNRGIGVLATSNGGGGSVSNAIGVSASGYENGVIASASGPGGTGLTANGSAVGIEVSSANVAINAISSSNGVVSTVGTGIGIWGLASDTGTGVIGGSVNGYGVKAAGGLAPLKLEPSTGAGAPSVTGHQNGEFYVDSAGKLYYFKGGSWITLVP